MNITTTNGSTPVSASSSASNLLIVNNNNNNNTANSTVIPSANISSTTTTTTNADLNEINGKLLNVCSVSNLNDLKQQQQQQHQQQMNNWPVNHQVSSLPHQLQMPTVAAVTAPHLQQQQQQQLESKFRIIKTDSGANRGNDMELVDSSIATGLINEDNSIVVNLNGGGGPGIVLMSNGLDNNSNAHQMQQQHQQQQQQQQQQHANLNLIGNYQRGRWIVADYSPDQSANSLATIKNPNQLINDEISLINSNSTSNNSIPISLDQPKLVANGSVGANLNGLGSAKLNPNQAQSTQSNTNLGNQQFDANYQQLQSIQQVNASSSSSNSAAAQQLPIISSANSLQHASQINSIPLNAATSNTTTASSIAAASAANSTTPNTNFSNIPQQTAAVVASSSSSSSNVTSQSLINLPVASLSNDFLINQQQSEMNAQNFFLNNSPSSHSTLAVQQPSLDGNASAAASMTASISSQPTSQFINPQQLANSNNTSISSPNLASLQKQQQQQQHSTNTSQTTVLVDSPSSLVSASSNQLANVQTSTNSTSTTTFTSQTSPKEQTLVKSLASTNTNTPSSTTATTTAVSSLLNQSGMSFLVSPLSSANLIDNAVHSNSSSSSINDIIPKDFMSDLASDNEKKTIDSGIHMRIEQAMDLVKSHLTMAVKEEIVALKNQIKQLKELCNRLEQENSILKQNATPETLKLIESRANLNASTSSMSVQSNGGSAPSTASITATTLANPLVNMDSNSQLSNNNDNQPVAVNPNNNNNNNSNNNEIAQDSMISSFTEQVTNNTYNNILSNMSQSSGTALADPMHKKDSSTNEK